MCIQVTQWWALVLLQVQKSLETLVRRCLGHMERIQAGHIDVVRVIIKFIKGNGKGL
jgi:hypothetical protein